MARIGDMLRLVMIATLLALAAATNYSKKGLCKRGTHTMVYYKDKPAKACGKVLKDKCTEDDKRNILAEHNRLRQLVASDEVPGQPAAVSMPNMEWNDELAMIAQRWADQCKHGHDKCRNTDQFYVGQNVARIGSTAGSSEPEMVEHWFRENKDLKNSDEISKFTAKYFVKTGHYTQLVWAESTELGCGCITYKADPLFTTTCLVCNYGPGGNIIDQPIYQIRK